MNDLAEMVRDATNASMASFKAGHDEGYRLGFAEGWKQALAKAMEIIKTPVKPEAK